MEYVVKKTGIGVAVDVAIQDLKLQRQRKGLQAMMISIFKKRLSNFKQAHSKHFRPANIIRGQYMIQNQYPLTSKHEIQYFRAVGYQMVMGGNRMLMVVQDEQKKEKFVTVEGFCQNIVAKKRFSLSQKSARSQKSVKRRKSANAKSVTLGSKKRKQ